MLENKNNQDQTATANDMSASDICNVIAEAAMMQDIDEIARATKMLMKDLGDALLASDALWYLKSGFTDLPYISETMTTLIFDDEYYAQKYADTHSTLKLLPQRVERNNYKRMFAEIYDCGIGSVAYCNNSKSVALPIDVYFLTVSTQKNACNARELTRYIAMLMQEIRNDERQYDRKNQIVDLLKKNVISSMTGAKVFVPINAIKDVHAELVVDISFGTNLKVSTMRTDDNRIFFPVYTSVAEYKKNSMQGLNLVSIPLGEFIRFVRHSIDRDPSVIGVVVNSGSFNFAINKSIMDIFLSL